MSDYKSERFFQLRALMKERILILDGAMGTMIQKHRFEEEHFRTEGLKDHPVSLQGNNDLLVLSQPQAILNIHREYLEAGADLVETNTFSGTQIAQADYQCEHLVDDINYQSASLARQACDEYNQKTPDKPRFVAGALGPTNKTASLSPDVNDPGFRAVTFDQLKANFKQQSKALLEGGSDILLLETNIDTLNVKAALYAIGELMDEQREIIPTMLSGTIADQSGRTLSGQTVEAFLISVSHMPLLTVGFNCALGADLLRQHIAVLSEQSEFPVHAYPNAGLPNEFGQYDQNPQQMKELLDVYLNENIVNLLGGCCGTTPAHIQAIAEAAKNHSPRNFQDLVPEDYL